ncbi:MAG: HAMP domain-containing sensor histidine kinase [Verrucomicrobiota bacterium]
MSLKWKIQVWHAIILAIVLAVLGVGFFYNERAHRLSEYDFLLDQQIHPLVHAAAVMNGTMNPMLNRASNNQRRPRPGDREDRRPPGSSGSRPGSDYSGRSGPGSGGQPGPPSGSGGPFDRESMNDVLRAGYTDPNSDEGWVRSVDAMRPRGRNNFSDDRPAPFAVVEERYEDIGFYALVWTPQGNEMIYKSDNAPDLVVPALHEGYWKRIRDHRFREILHSVPHARIIVGFDLEKLNRQLGVLKWQILGVNSLIFVFGVAIGSLFVSRSLAPLGLIAETSEAIAGGKIDERIPKSVGRSTTELANLSSNLNHTFDELEDLFQRQVRFTADASHELRTPLTSLIAQIELGRSRERSIMEFEEILDTCNRSVKRIKRITDDLLELSRYDSGRFSLELEELPVRLLVESLIEDLRPIVNREGSTITTEHCLGNIYCDPFRLEQVITNLVNNALQHNNVSIDLIIRSKMEPDAVVIEVIDNGKGIQPDSIEKLFDRFFQENLSRTKSRHTLNVGLGLCISRAIVEAHRGTISVTSIPCQETCFAIRLPRRIRG